MAFISGARDVQADTDDHILDLERGLDFLNPVQDGVKFLKKIGLNGAPVKSYKHEWTETSLGVRSETWTLAADSTTTVTVGDAYMYTVDDLVRVEDEVIRVSAIASATTLTIVRGEASTTAAAYASGATAYKIGTARAENSTHNVSVTDTASRLFNYVQTFDKTVEMTTHEIAQLSTESGNPMTGQLKRRFIETTRDLAAAFLMGVRDADTTNKRYYAGGLKHFITTNVLDNSAADVSVTALDGRIKAIVDAGGHPNVLLMNTTQKQKLDAIDADLVRIGKETKMGGNPNVQTWQSGVMDGTLEIIVDHTVPQNEIWVLDTSLLSINKMSNNGAGHGFKLIDATAKGQDGKITRILGHYTFMVRQEAGMALLSNLGT